MARIEIIVEDDERGKGVHVICHGMEHMNTTSIEDWSNAELWAAFLYEKLKEKMAETGEIASAHKGSA
jgi:hypothetical protein